MKSIMIVDDETYVLQALRRSLASAFRGELVAFEFFSDPHEALERAAERSFAVVMADFRMPGMDGITFLKQIRALQPDATRLILSASTDFSTVLEAVNGAEVERYLVKPWSDAELEQQLRLAMERQTERSESSVLADEARLQRSQITPEELERRRLEREEPGITRVNWGPDGSVLLD